MRTTLIGLLGALVLLAFALVLVGQLAGRPLYRDPPRDLPWVLPDYREAKTSWQVDRLGRIRAHVEHFFLEDISPEMIAWFYQQLPIASIDYRGQRYPLYHIFHPSEHGRLRVLEPAPDGTPGMATGAVIEREEWFGPYDSRGAARLVTFSDEGMLAVPEVAGIEIGEVRHVYEAGDGGTHYRVEAVIGSDLPLAGRWINYYLRTRVFHPGMMTEWQRHQIEEVASLQFFLPALYAQREAGSPFRLSDPSTLRLKSDGEAAADGLRSRASSEPSPTPENL